MKNKELWQMWSLRWSEKPEERDRNPSAPQTYGDRSVMVNTLDCGSDNAGSIPVDHPRCRNLELYYFEHRFRVKRVS